MNTRERWLTFGLIVVSLGLLGIGFWQHVRYQDAQEAVRRYVSLDDRADRSERRQRNENAPAPDEDDQAVISTIRQAQPEIRRILQRGDFGVALERLESLEKQNSAGRDPEIRGNAIPVDELWPPKSPEREKARSVLRRLAEKQAQGYDMTTAQDALVRLAEEARKGRRKEALERFEAVALAVDQAVLRPGFRLASAPGGPGMPSVPSVPGMPMPGMPMPGAPGGAPGMPMRPGRPGAPGAPGMPQDAQVERALTMMTAMISQRMEEVKNPEARALVQRLLSLLQGLQMDLRQGKSVTPVLMQLGGLRDMFTQAEPDLEAAEKILSRAEAMRARLPMRPRQAPGTVPPAGGPGGPGRPMPGRPGVPPPTLPPVGVPPSAPGGVATGDQIMAQIDRIRKMPEAEYQRQRPTIAAIVNQLTAGSGPAAPQVRPVAGGGPSIGEAQLLRLEWGSRGELTTLRALGRDLSKGIASGGWALRAADGSERPVASLPKSDKGAISQTVPGPEGRVTATFRQEGEELALRATVTRSRPGSGGHVVFRVPLQLAGWRWQGGGVDGQVIAVDGQYRISADGAENLSPVVLKGAGVTLTLAATSASEVSYDPAAGLLSIRLPLPARGESVEHLVRLAVDGS